MNKLKYILAIVASLIAGVLGVLNGMPNELPTITFPVTNLS